MGKKHLVSMQDTNGGKTVEKGLQEFIQNCKIKNLSPDTIHFYQSHFNRFEQFIEAKNISMLQNINKGLVNDYVIHLREKLENPISVNSYLRCVRAFLYFCMKLEYLSEFKIELIKAEKKIKETYTDAELRALLRKPNLKDCSFAEYRDWAIINFLLGTGVKQDLLLIT